MGNDSNIFEHDVVVSVDGEDVYFDGVRLLEVDEADKLQYIQADLDEEIEKLARMSLELQKQVKLVEALEDFYEYANGLAQDMLFKG